MIEINPTPDIIGNQFDAEFATVDQDQEEVNGLIFTKRDILETPDMLAQLLRSIFVRNNVTYQLFDIKYREYAQNQLNLPPSKWSTSKGNLLRAIKRPTVTYNKFVETVVLVLGYHMNMSVTLTGLDGKVEVFDRNRIHDQLLNEA